MLSIFERLHTRSLLSAVCLLLALGTISCGSSNDYIFTDPPGGSAPIVGSRTLTVRPDSDTSVRARISSAATSFVVTLLSTDGQAIDERVVGPRQPAVFTELADGRYKVRTVGRDDSGAIIGYFDMIVVVPQQSEVTVPTLIYTSSVPAPDSRGTAFLAITEFPDVVVAGAPFAVTVQAFDADGYPADSEARVSLSATGTGLTIPTAQTDLQDGEASFGGLVTAQNASGSVTLQAAAPGFRTAMLPALVVRSQPPQPMLRLRFEQSPSNAITGRALDPAVSVRVTDQNGQTITSPLLVTISLSTVPAPPAGGALVGTLTRTAVNGVATFSDLSFSSAGTYALNATAASAVSATSAPVVVTDSVQPVPGNLFVGQTNSILSFALASLDEAINDIDSDHTFSNGQSTGNFLFIAPVGGDDDFWATVEGDLGEILLFPDVVAMASGSPSKLLLAESYSELLAYDDAEGRLFSAGYDVESSSFEVSIFDDALSLANGAGPTRTVRGFTELQGIAVDEAGDRLFVITSRTVADEEELSLHVFADVATVGGDQSTISHQVVELAGLTRGVYGLFYDQGRDRLYFAQQGGNQLYALADIDSLGGTVEQPASQAPATTTWAAQPTATFWSPWVDVRTDKLYISDYENDRVLVWNNASGMVGSQTAAPDAILSGSRTGLASPLPVVVLP